MKIENSLISPARLWFYWQYNAKTNHIAPRPVNPLHPGVAEVIIVLRGDDAAGDHFDVTAARIAQAPDQFGDQRFVARREAARADDVCAAFQRQHHGFLGRLEQRARVDIKAHIAKGRRDDIRPAIMPVLTHFGDEQLGLAAQAPFDGGDAVQHLLIAVIAGIGGAIDAPYRDGLGRIAAKGDLHRTFNRL